MKIHFGNTYEEAPFENIAGVLIMAFKAILFLRDGVNGNYLRMSIALKTNTINDGNPGEDLSVNNF